MNTEKADTMMVAAFAVQTGLVSLHPPAAHSKLAETSLVSVSETHFASEQSFLCQWS